MVRIREFFLSYFFTFLRTALRTALRTGADLLRTFLHARLERALDIGAILATLCLGCVDIDMVCVKRDWRFCCGV